MPAPHLCKDYGLSIQQREVTTHLVVSDVLSVSNLTIYIIPEDAETKLSMAFYKRQHTAGYIVCCLILSQVLRHQY